MKTDAREIERLRFALSCLSARRPQSRSRTAPSAHGCRHSDQIWEAVGGELSTDQMRDLVDHLAECPVCAESWRLARQIRAESGLQVLRGGSGRPAAGNLRGWAGLAAAALIILTAGLSVWRLSQTPATPVIRGLEQEVIEFNAGDKESLPREHFRLTWSLPKAEPGVRYNVQVMTLQLEQVAAAAGLDVAEFTVPPQLLSQIPSGTLLIWRVEAVYPDGRRTGDQTISRLE